MLKLNLGCGNKKIHGFINIDGRTEVEPDLVYNITKINDKFNNVDLIYACHVLEHFPYKKHSFYDITCVEVLNNWYDSLKQGGILRVSVPDFEAISKYYFETKELNSLSTLLMGGQKYDFDFHLSCWDFATLKSTLEKIGFKNIKKYDWRKTEHNFIDDYSQAYLPHMDKINGSLMSLNIEAIK